MKTTKIHIIISLITCLVTSTIARADAITMDNLPYLCDFENETENANWVLNPYIETITTENRWVIGQAAAYTGEHSLYVSQDDGATQTYASTNNVLLAYRDITLEAGDYDVAYDWMGLGNKTKGYLKIIYVNRPTSGLKCIGNSTEPTWVAQAVQLMGQNTSLIDGDTWYHVQARVSIPVAQANKATTRLLFVWVNTDVTVKDSITSVAIDNFQLAKASPDDDYPTNIHVSTSLGVSTVSWEGTADNYEVMYRKRDAVEFDTVYTDNPSVVLTNIEYGAYEFWISGLYINGTDTIQTIYSVFPTVYLYETDCFDALNMYNAEFEYGTWGRSGKTVKGNDRVDYGPHDIRSHHTTHFDLEEIDPRTVVMSGRDTVAYLKTVPSGQFGSVRLGNWNTGSEYESMTFHYTVESSSTAVLLIQYAMVLENPEHTAVDQPRFTLEVLDEAGDMVDLKCGAVDFHAPTPEEWNDPEIRAIWHRHTYEGHDINWQEWKVIGLNTEDYMGQTLTIRLTSYDCDQGGHFGYAYFMLNCVRSDVDGLPWGEGSSTRMFTAPEGFNYAWFNRTDVTFSDTIDNTDPTYSPYITDGGRFFYVLESDTNTYLCHVTYPTNAECGFWFDASAKPHNPKAELEFQWTPENCENGYIWWNRCHVALTNQTTGAIEHRYDKQLESCFLIVEGAPDIPIGYIEDGTYVPMPVEGGTAHYCVWTGVYVNDELFADTVCYDFEVPAIGPLDTHLYDTICRGESVVFPAGSHDKYSDNGEYLDNLVSTVTGCDSVVHLHLYVHEAIEVEAYDTICPGSSYSFAGRTLTTTGVYTGLFASEVTGCDSVVTLYLKQAPKPSVSLVSDKLCSDEPLIFTVADGFYADSMRIHIDGMADTTDWIHRDGAQTVIELTNRDIGPHAAIVQLTMPWCETVFIDTLSFGVSIASNVIELHWNDMLVFLSPEYNGGLTFRSYQWYRNGAAIEGATQSYYYEAGLNLYDEYSVRVTLANGSEAWVCPFIPANPYGITNPASESRQPARKLIRHGHLIIQCNGREYDAQGRIVK